MSETVQKEKDEILEHVHVLIQALSLPEWVGEAFDAGTLCGAYNDDPPVSGVVEEGSEENTDIQNIVAEIQKTPLGEMNREIPFYTVICAEGDSTGYFILTVPTLTDEYGEEWEQQVKDAADGKVAVYFGENGKLADPRPIPMKVVPCPIYAAGEDRSCIMLEPFSDEEYKKMGYDLN